MERPTAFIDLEGVLFPEMWPAIAQTIGDPALEVTTRDVADYGALMDRRLRLLRANGVTLADVQGIVGGLKPLPGAVAFIEALSALADLVIVTDSFAPMNAAALAHFPVGRVFTNHLVTDHAGFASECIYWHKGQGKARVYDAVPGTGPIFAMGDGFNDLEMLRRADVGILFAPSEATRRSAAQLPVLLQLDHALARFSEFAPVP
ncbi:bifunctional phosphoserine phosphatase/homoserine phosphotransferase ThrH [Pseudosulfitobacter koreensis]|uniref:phosphoserine phosphatase n=1 Tax=Pseudosulfitobacter koreensis TaxID=2968472 RepID=A0ABT1YXH8_9RHOB|nr:bifunctional phosphoserine phosphatase/homoserine phosphotransferase ThrH [Pseudosulfitobacter koreense]MCR8825595.1 bifunctional phosphoserine phosphatase/homoserine phosphotransferase ThrH [Pseudosulfitobacter koreense]